MSQCRSSASLYLVPRGVAVTVQSTRPVIYDPLTIAPLFSLCSFVTANILTDINYSSKGLYWLGGEVNKGNGLFEWSDGSQMNFQVMSHSEHSRAFYRVMSLQRPPCLPQFHPRTTSGALYRQIMTFEELRLSQPHNASACRGKSRSHPLASIGLSARARYTVVTYANGPRQRPSSP